MFRRELARSQVLCCLCFCSTARRFASDRDGENISAWSAPRFESSRVRENESTPFEAYLFKTQLRFLLFQFKSTHKHKQLCRAGSKDSFVGNGEKSSKSR